MKRQATALALTGVLMLCATVPAAAQAVPDHRLLVRVSPIALMFTNFKLGAEYMVTPKVAAEVNVNHNKNFFGTELSVSSAMAGARYYPTQPFGGFSVGGHLGMLRLVADPDEETYPMLHLELAYSWLLGDDDRFYVAPAVGAARIFASGTFGDETAEDSWTLSIPLPTWRLSIGYRF